jgi:hypothetical protein
MHQEINQSISNPNYKNQNKPKYLNKKNNSNNSDLNDNPYTKLVDKIESYTQFLEYGKHVDILEFSIDFYNTDKLDNNIQENIGLMKNDFGRFWNILDFADKNKYICLVEKYIKNK